MNTSTSNLRDKVVKRAVNSLRKSKRIEQLSFIAIANELNVRVDEIQAFYTTTEDIFFDDHRGDHTPPSPLGPCIHTLVFLHG